jgi:hypothetical protein
MLFDFKEYLTLATELAARNDDAALRTSVSRAYYAAFHLANDRAEAIVGSWNSRKAPNRIPRHQDKTSHAWCWLQYTDSNDLSCKQIGVDGDRIKLRRHFADYRTANKPDLAAEAKRTVAEAQRLRAAIAGLPPNLPAPQP